MLTLNQQHRVGLLIKGNDLQAAEDWFRHTCVACALKGGHGDCEKRCALKEMQNAVEDWFCDNTDQNAVRWEA